MADVHLHHFRIDGEEYGCARVGGPFFEDDPRQVPLGQLRLHQGERFTMELAGVRECSRS
jgi:hypothetical protein